MELRTSTLYSYTLTCNGYSVDLTLTYPPTPERVINIINALKLKDSIKKNFIQFTTVLSPESFRVPGRQTIWWAGIDLGYITLRTLEYILD